MFKILKRLANVAESEAHAVLDKLEDPIKMTEQGIRDLKSDLGDSLKSLAQVKALTLRLKRDLSEQKNIASDYERKAMLLLEKAAKGELDAAEADRLAMESLSKKEAAIERAKSLAVDLANQEKMVAQLEVNVKSLKSQITKWENEMTTLKARAKVAASTKKLNEQLAKVDSDSTISMLEKMKSKVQEDEALAESYGEIASADTSVDSEIDKALGGSASVSQSESLAALKKKMGMG
ncbi:MAG: PspA/IM30 family protein [Spirochaetia bacterium]|nr:PspA/IM30 family protein [Spirochaetia bacterium]